MDSQIIPLCFSSFYLHTRRIMKPPSLYYQFAHLRTNLHFTYLIQKPANGAPTLHFHQNSALPRAFIPHWGTRFCILYIFPTFIYYFLYKHLLLPAFAFVVIVGDLLSFWPHATQVTLGLEQSSHSPSPASSISSKYYPGHLPFIL
jgi:hypothetical protein